MTDLTLTDSGTVRYVTSFSLILLMSFHFASQHTHTHHSHATLHMWEKALFLSQNSCDLLRRKSLQTLGIYSCCVLDYKIALIFVQKLVCLTSNQRVCKGQDVKYPFGRDGMFSISVPTTRKHVMLLVEQRDCLFHSTRTNKLLSIFCFTGHESLLFQQQLPLALPLLLDCIICFLQKQFPSNTHFI